ncbi:TRAP transporter substrate-binding protein [Mesorhizobium sp. LHD-90]|uniref:TRAP transporter substrate-binding protein n=1 Tax=Mesorhizobium sp. LHD-90 TaxID=3071414 RepID=UPI0027E0D730|nr:TRAP transporter substrate-binding protein [Mesorhizobium sp. LHD-90]MDQ6434893.1 TRAP transporter substrate-binding protein [Mesorhizobium sp. LHD-90]
MASTGAALAAPALLGSGPARAQETVTLKLHHFLPPVSNVHAKLLVPWTKTIEENSQGRLKIEIFPAMQLGGKPPQLYDQAANGVVDIVWTLPGNTPGRFPSTEVFELPFIAARNATANAPAAQEYGETHLAKETADTKILCFWAHDHGLIHTNKPIAKMEDLAGLKLRNPTRLAGEALTALGATSVGMPVPQVPEALAQGTIDGCVIPWEVVPSVKVDELTKFHTEIPASPTLYTTTFFLAMNKARYEGLPDDLKAVLDKNSGMAFAKLAGEMWDTVGAEVRAKVEAGGKGTISSISEEEKARWVEATKPVHVKWVEGVKAKGLDGDALIKTAQELIAKYSAA